MTASARVSSVPQDPQEAGRFISGLGDAEAPVGVGDVAAEW